MALKAVKGTFERMLDKNLQDLVRGIRNHKDDEAKYIAECIEEIKSELKLDNLASKANAINKLIYLQMLGNDIGWAAFNVIEVMSSTKFTYKRIGYLAASQSFHEQTDVLMLTTNLIRKDLNSPNFYETGIALTGLSCFLTTDLARDLANDIMTLMNSTKPYIRKKAVLLMYKVFLKFPDALRPAFPRLKEKLEDPDPGVQSAAVNVICELARKNPKNYLSLAPLFFKLMNSSNNNWVLIKIIKLFGALTPLEPRLGKKLIEPLTNLIHSTSAMSLLYECINTVIAGIPNHSASIQLCVQKLRILIEDSDQNLKYLGLLAMTKILKSHPKSVQAHKDLILNCLDDKDESIRLRALDLLYGMISKKNIMEIVKKLMCHVDKTEGVHYRNELLVKIIQITSQDNYQYITNFEWYITVLVELTRVEGIKNGDLIANQLLDVAIRVPTVRDFTVRQMACLLQTSKDLVNGAVKQSGMCEVVYAAAWICGEYPEFLTNPERTLGSMLDASLSIGLPSHTQSILVQNILKLYCYLMMVALGTIERSPASDTTSDVTMETGPEAAAQLTQSVLDKLAQLVHSSDLEVQERAVSGHQLLRYVLKQLERNNVTANDTVTESLLNNGITENFCETTANNNNISNNSALVAKQLAVLFSGEVNPVTSKAQRKVPIPEGLDLDAWINDPPEDHTIKKHQQDSDESEDDSESLKKRKKRKKQKKGTSKSHGMFFEDTSPTDSRGGDTSSRRESNRPEMSEEQLEQFRQARLREQESNPHYLKDSTGSASLGNAVVGEPISDGYINLGGNDDLPPVQPLQSLIGKEKAQKMELFPSSDYYLTQQKKMEITKKKASGKKKKDSKKKKNKDVNKGDDEVVEEEAEPKAATEHVVRLEFDNPEGVNVDNEDGDPYNQSWDINDPHRLLNIDLEIPVIEKSKPEESLKSKKTKSKKLKTNKKVKENKEVKNNSLANWLEDAEDNDNKEDKNIVKTKQNYKVFDDLENSIITSDDFSKLLSSGKLKERGSIHIKEGIILVKSFRKLVKAICKVGNLTVVEEIEKTVSLYAKTKSRDDIPKRFHVCLLLKLESNGHSLRVDGKSNDLDTIKKVVKCLKRFVISKFSVHNLSDRKS